ncbi:methylmalonyl Co-A mutase-associated GTPase MeaB [bacterium]|nr:methylmalonyl Co-A mutase-associated GTPase MeaB [bacterium]
MPQVANKLQHINPNITRKKRLKPNLEWLKEHILLSDKTAISQAITLVESSRTEDKAKAHELLNWAIQQQKPSYRIGITGVPGAGKSTFIETFGKMLIERGNSLAVLAIDPSSSRSHGSILGDKTRMNELSKRPEAYIRPSAAGKTLGGLAGNTREAMVICEAAGFNYILIETVGVGQSETAVKNMVDFFLLLLIAGGGDELQGMKRGIIEMSNAIVINKADGPNALQVQATKTEYARAVSLFPLDESGQKTRVMSCSALTGTGMNEVLQMIEDFKSKTANYKESNRQQQAFLWMTKTIESNLLENFYSLEKIKKELQRAKELIAQGKRDPLSAAHEVLSHYFETKNAT